MNAHLLLQQLLEEYGLSGHNSAHIDDSVSEYVMEAMAGDSLESEEKLEFGTSSWGCPLWTRV